MSRFNHNKCKLKKTLSISNPPIKLYYMHKYMSKAQINTYSWQIHLWKAHYSICKMRSILVLLGTFHLLALFHKHQKTIYQAQEYLLIFKYVYLHIFRTIRFDTILWFQVNSLRNHDILFCAQSLLLGVLLFGINFMTLILEKRV